MESTLTATCAWPADNGLEVRLLPYELDSEWTGYFSYV